jgi:hypothetical protein
MLKIKRQKPNQKMMKMKQYWHFQILFPVMMELLLKHQMIQSRLQLKQQPKKNY